MSPEVLMVKGAYYTEVGGARLQCGELTCTLPLDFLGPERPSHPAIHPVDLVDLGRRYLAVPRCSRKQSG